MKKKKQPTKTVKKKPIKKTVKVKEPEPILEPVKEPEPEPEPQKAMDTKPPIDLATFLGEYKEPMTVTPQATDNKKPVEPVNGNISKPLENIISSGMGNDVQPTVPQGEVKYYRTGKKAGQPRPVKPPGNVPPVQPVQPLPQQQVQGQPVQNSLISGALFLVVIDVAIPYVIVFINNKYSKIKMTAGLIQLSKEQKKDLEPIAEEVVRYLNIRANPVLIFTVSIGGMYAMNYNLQKTILQAKQTLK